MDYTFRWSDSQTFVQKNSTDPTFGIVWWNQQDAGTASGNIASWHASDYGSNSACILISATATAGLLGTSSWRKRMMYSAFAEIRTTGRNGYRPSKISANDLTSRGWKVYFHDMTSVDGAKYSPHYGAQAAAYSLFMGACTGLNKLFRVPAVQYVQGIMNGLFKGTWQWTQSMTNELGTLLLTLAWLVRVDPGNAVYIEWLDLVANKLLVHQTKEGGIRQFFGTGNESGKCHACVPKSNAAYGDGEAPLMFYGNETITDCLYSLNFISIGLREAYGATKKEVYRLAEEKLVNYLVRIQVTSTVHPELDGAWFRAFEYSRWEYWASDSDWGYGPWVTDNGWTNGWIQTSLALRHGNTTLWDVMMQESGEWDMNWVTDVCKEMLMDESDEYCTVDTAHIFSNTQRHAPSLPVTSSKPNHHSTNVQRVQVDESEVMATTASSFLGVNIDSASLYQGTRLDFQDTRLVSLATALASQGPGKMTLRLGGSAADDLSTFVNDTSHGAIYLDTQYWNDLVNFVRKTGFALVWDLNMRVGRSLNASRAWDPQDAERLLEHMAKNDQLDVVSAFQLGNEPGHFRTRNGGLPTATEHSKDFVQLSLLLDKYYNGNDGNDGNDGNNTTSSTAKQRPRIQGPDVCMGSGTDVDPCADLRYFTEVLNGASQVLDDVTVHAYGLIGPVTDPARRNYTQCNVASFLNVSRFRHEFVVPAVKQWQKSAHELVPHARLIVSETATTGDGGCYGLSNRFIAGFYFLDILGELGDLGVHQVYRQDLVGFSGINGGSRYALTGHAGWYSRNSSGPLNPNPDYFTGMIWRKLVGSKRLKINVNENENENENENVEIVNTHAACAVGGGVVVSFINPTNVSVTVIVEGNGEVELWILTADNLTSSTMLLNGKVLTPTTPLVPKLKNVKVGGGIVVPPFSYGFLVNRTKATKSVCYSSEF